MISKEDYRYENHCNNKVRIDKVNPYFIDINIVNLDPKPCKVGDVKAEYLQVYLIKLNLN